MYKIMRKISAVISASMIAVMALVGFYSLALPDSYIVPEGGNLMVKTLFSVSAKPAKNEVTEAFSGETAKENETLMLFGSVPVKNVSTKTSGRPLLVPCGEAFGIKLITDGVMVVDLTKSEVSPASQCGIKEGDIIISINGEKVRSNGDVAKIISESKGQACPVVLRRDGHTRTVSLVPQLSDGKYRAGMWVRDSSAGIGTITYFNPSDNSFGGLGHPICDSDTKEILPLSEGTAGEVKITGCIKSEKGKPGQLLGEFRNSSSIGDIYENCREGIFGTLNENPSENTAIPMAFRQEVHTGEAYILASTDGNKPEKYSVNIEQVNLNDSEHDLVVKVTDERLVEKAGGIVQGMSGSPIIQDGRLVGAVTHVFIDNPQMGYGIFAETMYRKSSSVSDKTTGLAG